MKMNEFIKKAESESPLLKAWGTMYRVQETIKARIELNNSIIKNGCDDEVHSDLDVENTALEFVLMLFENEE